MTDAISSARPARPSAEASTIARVPSVSASSRRPIGVSITPGDTDTIRAPRAPQLRAVRRTRRSTPKLGQHVGRCRIVNVEASVDAAQRFIQLLENLVRPGNLGDRPSRPRTRPPHPVGCKMSPDTSITRATPAKSTSKESSVRRSSPARLRPSRPVHRVRRHPGPGR